MLLQLRQEPSVHREIAGLEAGLTGKRLSGAARGGPADLREDT